MQSHTHSPALDCLFLALQSLVVLFLFLHDWIPLGRLNNLRAIRTQDSVGQQLFVTLLPGIPAAVCLIGSGRAFGQAYPDWLTITFWITYVLFLTGMLRAWWIPYLFVQDRSGQRGIRSFLLRHMLFFLDGMESYRTRCILFFMASVWRLFSCF
jgi:hypothetical protein